MPRSPPSPAPCRPIAPPCCWSSGNPTPQIMEVSASPQSTAARSSPVTKDDLSLARKRAASATSSVGPNRPRGCLAIQKLINAVGSGCSLKNLSFIGVMICARRDRVDPDFVGRELDCRLLRERVYAALGRRVGGAVSGAPVNTIQRGSCGYDASDRRRRSPEPKLVGSARRSSPRPKPSGRGPLYELDTWPGARS